MTEPIDLTYRTEDGATLYPHIYDTMPVYLDAHQATVTPRHTVSLPLDALPEPYRALMRHRRNDRVLAHTHSRVPVNADAIDLTLNRMIKIFTRLDITNRSRDLIFSGRPTTVAFTVVPFSGTRGTGYILALTSVEVEI